jgi:hypothetical protein
MTIKFDQTPVSRGTTEAATDVLGGASSKIVTVSAAQLAGVNTYLDKIAAGTNTSAVETAITNA